MPILGIVASGKTASTISTNSYQSIATFTVGSGGSSSISFSSIPATFKHLQIRCLMKSTSGGTDAWAWSLQAYLNADTTVANYAYHRIRGDNGNNIVADGNGSGIGQLGFIPGVGQANQFGPSIIDILDYTNTNKYTTFRAMGGSSTNGVSNSFVGFQSQLWQNTAAVNAIELKPSGGSFAEYSSFALYGIEG